MALIKLLFLLAYFGCSVRGDDFHFDPNLEDSKAHLEDDLHGQIDKKVSEMNADELQFHYFRQHDFDDNGKLDGIELISKLRQSELTNRHKNGDDGATSLKDEYIKEKIDGYLVMADQNKNGYIDFAEYKKTLTKDSR